MDKKEQRNQVILAIVLVIAVIGLGIYKYLNKNTKEIQEDDNKISIVKDSSRFYTVSSCVDKFFSTISSDNDENILILLSDNYKKDNNININNVNKFREKSLYTFNPRRMYVEKIGTGLYKYYAYGYKQRISTGFEEKIDYYVIVIMDETNMTFAVEPSDSESFGKLE